MADSTLQAIRLKTRRLTRSPSNAQLTDADIDQYINTFILYDFPEHLRLFSLRTTLTFYTQPGVDVYETNTTDPLDPLYNFKNKYVAVHPPLFIAGVPSFYTQWRDVFYGQWPQTNAVVNTLILGNGTTGPFTGIINSFPQFPNSAGPNGGAILQRSLLLTALNTDGTAMQVIDYPDTNNLGFLDIPNTVPDAMTNLGTINYQTGEFTVSFPNNTLVGDTNPIWAEYVPYVAGLPISCLYYDNKFTLRPVPDKSYVVNIEADIRPTELLQAGASPQIEQWWQFIAYGASKKIFEDRMDMDSVQMIMPEFLKQMNLVNRTSLTQQANERTVTIYTTGKSYGWPWANGSANFPF
jgi:hypothetical protein